MCEAWTVQINLYPLLYIVFSFVRGTKSGTGTCHLNAALSLRWFHSKTLKIYPPGQSGGLHPPERLAWPTGRGQHTNESTKDWNLLPLNTLSTREPDTPLTRGTWPFADSAASVSNLMMEFQRSYTCCLKETGKLVKMLMGSSMNE